MKRPNLLLLMADQFRWDAVGPGSDWVRTPNIDALAREGITFTHCIANAPVCKPARVSLATGLYPHNTGCWHNDRFELGARAPNWMRTVRDQGYRTALFGKLHLHRRHGDDLRADEPLVRDYGFDVVHEIVGPRGCLMTHSHMTASWQENGLLQAFHEDLIDRLQHAPLAARPSPLPLAHYYDVYIARMAREWLGQCDAPEPWFCKLSFAGPHEPWDAPEPFASLYAPGDMPRPVPRMRHSQAPVPGELQSRFSASATPDPDTIAACRANYAGNITLIDEQIGLVIDAIKARGEWDNTVVVFTADHGELNGDHGLVHKNAFLNGAIRVPLVWRLPPALRPPGAPATNGGMIELMDVGATLAHLAGEPPAHLQFARSALPLLDKPAAPLRASALAGFKGEMLLMTPQHKLALNRQGQPCLLLDIQADPDEQLNVVNDPDFRDVQTSLAEQLLSRLVAAQSYRPPAGKKHPQS